MNVIVFLCDGSIILNRYSMRLQYTAKSRGKAAGALCNDTVLLFAYADYLFVTYTVFLCDGSIYCQ